MYLDGTLCASGRSSTQVHMRLPAGAAAGRRVKGIIWDRMLEEAAKGKVFEASAVPACVYGSGRLVLS